MESLPWSLVDVRGTDRTCAGCAVLERWTDTHWKTNGINLFLMIFGVILLRLDVSGLLLKVWNE